MEVINMTLDDVLKHDEKFRYQLLDRMRSDCEYFLNCGGGTAIWGITVPEHIRYMKAIWKSFDKDKKPQWLGYRQIVAYERAMLAMQR